VHAPRDIDHKEKLWLDECYRERGPREREAPLLIPSEREEESEKHDRRHLAEEKKLDGGEECDDRDRRELSRELRRGD
jgi:hypothetical protein